MIPIKEPVIGLNCHHAQPFDYGSYLMSQKMQGLNWRCPICRKECYLSDLRTVGLIKMFLQQNPNFDYDNKVHIKGFTLTECSKSTDGICKEKDNSQFSNIK